MAPIGTTTIYGPGIAKPRQREQAQGVLGQESLDVALAYLKGSEAASESMQAQVAKRVLHRSCRGYNFAASEERMLAKQLRCEESFSVGYDPTGENARECGAPALACADCGDSAGCSEHAQLCPKCGEPVCAYYEDEHTGLPGQKPRAA